MVLNSVQSYSACLVKYLSFVFLFTVAVTQSVYAQVEKSSELFQTLARADSLLFEQSFNQCKHAVLDTIISDNLAFYHDTGGKQDRQAFEKAVRENICSDPNRKPIRKLIAGSLEVFPLRNNGQLYGVIQKGMHEFYMKEPGKGLYKTSIADFTHVWIVVNGAWKIETVLSYNHQVPE